MDKSLFECLTAFFTTIYNFLDSIEIPHTDLSLSTILILPFGIMIVTKCINKILDVGVSGGSIRSLKHHYVNTGNGGD